MYAYIDVIKEKCNRISEKNGLCQVTWIFDLEPLSYSTVPPFVVLKEVAHMFTYYYPERLYKLFIVFAPWYFRVVWNMMAPLLTENTKDKIEVVSLENSKNYKTFANLIDKDVLLTKYGGSLDLKYSYDFEVEQYKQYLLEGQQQNDSDTQNGSDNKTDNIPEKNGSSQENHHSDNGHVTSTATEQ
ncbi:hypothetical protein RFI_35860 [Reticulomyxa filosa]|uniref:CRAL-TRIO domain-containing protein n=1 Tax=Reticulomyxa filosa TaxID=46433 RepID=X6LJM8_RETFI|nr:hypothetical protein RFI_35860 [Reticulomyxa filosa]|eukprot:ETO01576.1 hypothetical protein RFI_35860 [Reticulomyxa filosa]